jgi:hypothetical protein
MDREQRSTTSPRRRSVARVPSTHGPVPASLFFTQWPVPSQVELLSHPGAQVPEQPSLPHCLLLQSGVHTHWPAALQVWLPLHPGAQVPLQPSLPHSLPLQLGMHTHVPWAVHI